MKLNKYVFYFKNGNIKKGIGLTVKEAFEEAGCIDMAWFALDFYTENGIIHREYQKN